MEIEKQFIQLMNYLTKHHPDIDPDNLRNEMGETAVLAAVKEFSGFDYDHNNKFFIKKDGNFGFATEVVELEKITTIGDLFHATQYLNDAYQKRLESMQKGIDLPNHLFTEPKEVQDISRKNIMSFLKQAYGLSDEKELFAHKEHKQQEIIYDLYRTFTGYVPSKNAPGSIFFSVPDNEELKMRYGHLPNFEHHSLFSHIRDMRKVHNNTQQLLKETNDKRLEELKSLSKSFQELEKDNDQERE